MSISDSQLSTQIDHRTLPRHTPQSESQSRRQAKMAYSNGSVRGRLKDVYEFLLVARVATSFQLKQVLGVAPSTLRRYQADRWITGSPVPDELVSMGLPRRTTYRDSRVYSLTRASYEYAKLQGRISNKSVGYDYMRMEHDLLCNHVVTELIKRASESDYRYAWFGAYESRQTNSDKTYLEPDARLVFTQSDRQMCFMVEYHNEDNSRRAAGKIEKYETQIKTQNWRRYWNGDKAPVVLIAYTHKAAYTGYVRELIQRRNKDGKIYGRYYALPVRRFLDKDGDATYWLDLNARANDEKRQIDLFE